MSYTEQYQSSLLKSIQDEEEKILDEVIILLIIDPSIREQVKTI
jgi:hypothetical protein